MIHYLTNNGILKKDHIVNIQIREHTFGGVDVTILDPENRFFPIYNTVSKLYNDGYIEYIDMIDYIEMAENITIKQLRHYYPIGSIWRALVKRVDFEYGTIELVIDFCRNVR